MSMGVGRGGGYEGWTNAEATDKVSASGDSVCESACCAR
jgi:hypothetical protein